MKRLRVLLLSLWFLGITGLLYSAPPVQIVGPDDIAFDVRNIDTETICSSTAVTANGSIYTNSFEIGRGEYFSVTYQATSASTTPNVGIELEQSYQVPATEGATDSEWVEPDNFADIATGIVTETVHHIALSPIALPYARFKVSGTNTASDTKITLKVSQQKSN